MTKHIVTIVLLGTMAVIGVVGYAALKSPAVASGPPQTIPVLVENPAAPSGVRIYELRPGESHARFMIDEVLRGTPKTVLGQTDQVTGQIALDLSQPATAQVGTILVNARTLATDDGMRDRQLRNFILATDQHEYIAFAPSGLTGLPEQTNLGTAYTFRIEGQLTIRGTAQPVTFDATVTPVSATTLNGVARTTIHYAEWGIAVPDVPFVAGVSDEVHLELDFIAFAA